MSEPTSHVTFTAPSTSHLAPLFPGYEIEMLIATGGMGAVYRAIQKSLDRTVAIKILPREFSTDKAFCESFEAEAKAMARLNHPNLIGVYDFGEVDGMLFIIMEYVPGQSLFDSAHGIAIDPGEVIRLVTGICNGLAHAHENGILHRDIKPSNILLDLNTEPKIGDFGLARPVDRKIQEGEEIFGTPHYTAPEVVNAPHSVNQRADIFSVGVMLHELLTGKLPADDKRPASAIILCDPRFDAIVRKATNPVPDLRYSSAAEISRELQVIAASAGPRVLRTAAANPSVVVPRPALQAPAHPSPPLGCRPTIASSQSKSTGIGGILMLVAAIALGVLAFIKLSQPAPAPPPRVVQPKPEAKPTKPAPAPEPPGEIDEQPGRDPAGLGTDHSDNQADANEQMESGKEPEEDQSLPNEPTTPTEPRTNEPSGPKFDVPGFLARARAIMQERANPLVANRDKSLADNLKSFEREVIRLIRRIDSRTVRDNAEADLEKFVGACAASGNLLPDELETPLNELRDLRDIHEGALEKQEAAEALLIDSLRQLSVTYILGIEKQIERLQPDDDPDAISLLKEEIENTRAKQTWFPNLMLGIDPEEEADQENNRDDRQNREND